MCGISGIVALSESGRSALDRLNLSVEALRKRGPDASGTYLHGNCGLGHGRLSIIDTSNAGVQPFTDPAGRYTIVFNGEFFNYQEHRMELARKGIEFRSGSDTEVLLHLYIREGEACLQKINGFFAFAIYDRETGDLFLARDRYGIKPLLVFQDENHFAFASEMKALMAFGIVKKPDYESIYHYLHLNYIPGPYSIFRGVLKMTPGTWMKLSNGTVTEGRWYSIPQSFRDRRSTPDYSSAQEALIDIMDDAVRRRLVSDVPLGAFLSGGIDSSVVVAMASRHVHNLNTFSIGYKDEPLFDETHYASLVAKRYNTNHTVFSLGNDDLFSHLFSMLDYIDEPFADSSALAVYILSHETRKHVTVALSGDGADELFGGYMKHLGEWQIRNGGWKSGLAGLLSPAFELLPGSRNSRMGNFARKLKKYAKGARLSPAERYWQWCGYADPDYLKGIVGFKPDSKLLTERKSHLSRFIGSGDMNEVLLNDMHLVLPGDMLTKVDLMSMANGLEVRVPFLDYEIVDFAFSLPADYKINGTGRKRIVQDAFRPFLPAELYNRPKHGFEVPLLKWFRTSLDGFIFDELLNPAFIKEQGIFRNSGIQNLRRQLHSIDPGDSTARIWALIVFQYWWKKWML